MTGDIVEYKRCPWDELNAMAEAACKSGMFGLANKEQAVTLLMLADADHIHPAKALQKYHIIKNKPSMKADAMLAEFLGRGGKVKWITFNGTEAKAVFIKDGTETTISFTIDDAKKAGLLDSNPTWHKYPDAMLRSRLISKAIRMVDPGCIMGVYTPDEVQEITEPVKAEPVNITPPRPQVIDVGEDVKSATLDNIMSILKSNEVASDIGLQTACGNIVKKYAPNTIGLSKLDDAKLTDLLNELMGNADLKAAFDKKE